MINRLKVITNSEDKRRLLGNFLSLSVLQGANYLLPLLTLPYLVRVLGPGYFGLLAFATAMVSYFQVLTDYGFNLTATREISIHKSNKEKVVEIFSSVMIIKSLLMLLSLVLITALVFNIEELIKNALVYFLTFGAVAGQVLFPVWFFQGMERMKYITYLGILSRLIFTVAIFVFVHVQADYYIVPILVSGGAIISGVLSLFLIKREFGIGFAWQGLGVIKKQLLDGWDIFLSSLQSAVLASSGAFVLGVFANYETVGVYSAIEKLSKAMIGLFSPISQALYPTVSEKLNSDRASGMSFLKKMSAYITCFFFLLTASIIIFSKLIIVVVLGDAFVDYTYVLQALSLWAFFSILNNFIGIQYLTALGYSRYYVKAFTLASITALTLYFTITPFANIVGILAGMLMAEIVLTVAMLYYIKRNAL
jgi:PST family polysaccharide transporter